MWKLLLVTLVSLAAPAVNADPVVETPLGTVSGILDSTLDVPVETFLGIPFAKAPVGERRFALPEAFGHFRDLDATYYRPICVQSVRPSTLNASEDCLHLNIFRRQGLTDQNWNVPVLIMIHGGAFAFGSTQEFAYNGVPLAAHGDMIVVTIHYRLGIFGFAETDLIPGNLGFYDQKLAIEWVHDHIKHFGGDNQQVTLMGVSAGSMSVSAHIMSPEIRDRNLFQSVIMDAGVIYGTATSSDATIARMRTIASKLGCAPAGEKMLTCLQNADVAELVKLSYDPEGYSQIVTFFPTADGIYLPRDWQTDEVDQYAKVRMLIGTATDEGATFVYHRVAPPETDAEFVEGCGKLSFAFKYPIDFKNKALVETIKKIYLSKYNNRLLALARFVGDGSFYCPVNTFLNDYVKHQESDVFVYEFGRLLSKTYYSLDPTKLGAFHGTPHIHFMGGLLTEESVDPEDAMYSLDAVEMISRFVHGESPSFRGVSWPDFAPTNKMMLFGKQPEVSEGLRHQEECEALFGHLISEQKQPDRKTEL